MTIRYVKLFHQRKTRGALGMTCAVISATALHMLPATAHAAPSVAPSGVPVGYKLVWADEFDADGLPDPGKWFNDTGHNKEGWHNHELQYYSPPRAANAVVKGGKLIVTARKEKLSSAADWGGQAYTSARLSTRGKGDWTYGFFDVRAKLPCGKGSWPAIWTLGSKGKWPDDGELDIMEQVGREPTRVFGTVHTLQSGGLGTGEAMQVPDACTAFHNYQMLWTRDEIRFSVDGAEFYRYANPKTGSATWPFDSPQYLILNLAVGGDLGGAVDDSIFPIAFEIDYVRIYQAAPLVTR